MTKLKLGYGVSLPISDNSIPNYSIENVELIKKLSENFCSIQVMFSKSKLSSDEITQIKILTKFYKYVFVHASYQINIGSELLPSQTDLYNVGLDILIQEIIYAKKIKACGIVLHMGKNVKKKYSDIHVYNNMVKFIVELFKRLRDLKLNIKILLETPAGQGGEMCSDINEFVDFVYGFKKQYFYSWLGVCIDTCHIFQAGIDLNNLSVLNNTHKIFSKIKDKIELIHLNDSFHPVESHIDRHEQIGKGHIQIDKLIRFVYEYKKVPMILETIGPYNFQINLIESEVEQQNK